MEKRKQPIYGSHLTPYRTMFTVLHELEELRKLIEKVEQDINRPLWMQFEDELRTVWDFLTLKFMRKKCDVYTQEKIDEAKKFGWDINPLTGERKTR